MPNRRRLSEKDVKYLLILAGKYHRKMGLPIEGREDRIQTAVLSVLRLARTYVGLVPFMAVAAIRIRYELIECVKTWKRQMKRKYSVLPAGVYDLGIDRTHEERDRFAEVDHKDFIDTMLAQTSNPRHRRVLESMVEGFSQRHAGIVAGLTEGRVSQLMKKQFKNLAKKLAGERMAIA